jgi:hypothetical protein
MKINFHSKMELFLFMNKVNKQKDNLHYKIELFLLMNKVHQQKEIVFVSFFLEHYYIWWMPRQKI